MTTINDLDSIRQKGVKMLFVLNICLGLSALGVALLLGKPVGGLAAASVVFIAIATWAVWSG
ncbi:MAG: hypothetical protein ACU0A6_15075 [Shimia sp.]|uniref:hypothetical protein n=1 Tax=Shimia sp. TaxID=1954381 RepID=UPI004058EC41